MLILGGIISRPLTRQLVIFPVQSSLMVGHPHSLWFITHQNLALSRNYPILSASHLHLRLHYLRSPHPLAIRSHVPYLSIQHVRLFARMVSYQARQTNIRAVTAWFQLYVTFLIHRAPAACFIQVTVSAVIYPSTMFIVSTLSLITILTHQTILRHSVHQCSTPATVFVLEHQPFHVNNRFMTVGIRWMVSRITEMVV